MAPAPDLSRILVVGRDLPDVMECYGLASHRDGGTCAQCDGSHHHEWVRCLVVHGDRPDIARRCRICGGRGCDAACIERRHHRGPHIAPNGAMRQVGA
jgi:hypothetical protein